MLYNFYAALIVCAIIIVIELGILIVRIGDIRRDLHYLGNKLLEREARRILKHMDDIPQ